MSSDVSAAAGSLASAQEALGLRPDKWAAMREGCRRFDAWMADQVAFGLSGLEADPGGGIDAIAASLTDYFLPAPAAALRDFVARVGTDPDWAGDFVAELGYWHVLCRLAAKADALAVDLALGVAVALGHRVRAETLRAGEPLPERLWTCVGIVDSEAGGVHARTTYWRGSAAESSGEQVAFQYGRSLPPGTMRIGTVAQFAPWAYPGGLPARLLLPDALRLPDRAGLEPRHTLPHAFGSWRAFREDRARLLAAQPWRREFPFGIELRGFGLRGGDLVLVDAVGEGLALPYAPTRPDHLALCCLAEAPTAPGTGAGSLIRAFGVFGRAGWRWHAVAAGERVYGLPSAA